MGIFPELARRRPKSKLRRMTLCRRRYALLAAVAASSACLGGDIVLEGEPYPDISGSWIITASGVPAGTTGSDGSCAFDVIRVSLHRAGDATLGDQYRGAHDGVRIECTGVTAAATATSGLADTVIVFPPDTMSAVVGRFCINFGCGPTVNVSMALGGLSFSGDLGGTARSMSGMVSVHSNDSLRIRGDWSAAR